MLLPVVLIFSLMLTSGLGTYMQALAGIDIYEKELAERYIADYQTTVCMRIVAESFVHDPFLPLDNGESGSSGLDDANFVFVPMIGEKGEINNRNCEVRLARSVALSSIQIGADITVHEPRARTYHGKIIFKNMKIEQILMKI